MESIQELIRIQVLLQVVSRLRIRIVAKSVWEMSDRSRTKRAQLMLLYHFDPRQESTSYICLIRYRTTNTIGPEQSPRNCRMM